MEKVMIYSHKNDIDGLGCIILAKLAFGEIAYALVSNTAELETKFNELYGKDASYNSIYITDLSLTKQTLENIKADAELSKKIRVFDHHISAIKEGCNDYEFTTIIDKDSNGKKRCGTDLFYEYLTTNGYLNKTLALDEFVELTRLEDTWEWKNNGEKGQQAHDLAILFNSIKLDNYRKNMTNKLQNNKKRFYFTKEEIKKIRRKKQFDALMLQKIWNDAEIFTDESENTFAALFADYELRNELAEYVRKLNIEKLKYLVIIALEKGLFGQKSYRAIEDGFDVGSIAESHGGGGHEAAASVNITEEQKVYALTLKKRPSLDYLVNSNYK